MSEPDQVTWRCGRPSGLLLELGVDVTVALALMSAENGQPASAAAAASAKSGVVAPGTTRARDRGGHDEVALAPRPRPS
jgi:hypothetical protein